MKTRTVIAEDDPLLRRLLAEILAATAAVEVVASVTNGQEALDAVARFQPEVLLLDLDLPVLTGFDVLRRLAERPASTRVLVLSGNEEEETQIRVARAGARGFLGKSRATSTGVLLEAIRAVADGEVVFGPGVVGRIFAEYPVLARRTREEERPIHRLTPDELQVLRGVVRGRTNQQIADELYVSVSTVKGRVRSILSKLELPGRAEAIVFGVREGLLDEPV